MPTGMKSRHTRQYRTLRSGFSSGLSWQPPGGVCWQLLGGVSCFSGGVAGPGEEHIHENRQSSDICVSAAIVYCQSTGVESICLYTAVASQSIGDT